MVALEGNRARKIQNDLLLAVSYLLYGWWDWRFLILILISTLVDFFCARSIDRSADPVKRRTLLTVSVAVNLTFLGFFKYFNFFEQSAASLLTALGFPVPVHLLQVVLPPGISFYTFQALAYITDVYFRRQKPAESLTDYALFIALFPHLVAGPIQRPSHLLTQVQRERRFSSSQFLDGLMLIASGLFRKCVVADTCALMANAAFSGRLGPPDLPKTLLGMYAFAWQIYGDFSGYSDIARGSAQLMGFHFMVNFRQPYLSRSLQEFWRRWHISLSTWLRDYLYIPLGGSRDGEARTYRNLMITMLLGGLWHGANWTFVIWGGIHGCWLSLERFFNNLTRRPAAAGHRETGEPGSALLSPRAWVQRILLFHLVGVTWVFFRATSLREAVLFLTGLGHWNWEPEYGVAFRYLALVVIPLFLLDLALEARNEEYVFEKSPEIWRVAAATSLVAVVMLFSANQIGAFIYFQF